MLCYMGDVMPWCFDIRYFMCSLNGTLVFSKGKITHLYSFWFRSACVSFQELVKEIWPNLKWSKVCYDMNYVYPWPPDHDLLHLSCLQPLPPHVKQLSSFPPASTDQTCRPTLTTPYLASQPAIQPAGFNSLSHVFPIIILCCLLSHLFFIFYYLIFLKTFYAFFPQKTPIKDLFADDCSERCSVCWDAAVCCQ